MAGMRQASAATRGRRARAALVAGAVAAAAFAGAALVAQPARAAPRQLLSERGEPTEAPVYVRPTKSPAVAPTKSPTRATPRPTAFPTAPSDSCVGFCNDFAPSGCSCRANCVPSGMPPTKAPVDGGTASPTSAPTRAIPVDEPGLCCFDACEACGYGTKDNLPDGPPCVMGAPTKSPTATQCLNEGTEKAGGRGPSIDISDALNGVTVSVIGDTTAVDPACVGKGMTGDVLRETCFSEVDNQAVYHELSLEGVRDTTGWVCRVETCEGSNYDTAIRLYNNDVMGGTLLSCQDDGCGQQTDFNFAPIAFDSKHFLLEVTGFADSAGEYTLSVTCSDLGGCLNEGTDDAGLIGKPLAEFTDGLNGATTFVEGDTSLVNPACIGKSIAIFARFPDSGLDCYNQRNSNTAVYHALSLEAVSDLTDWTCQVSTCLDSDFDTGVRLYDSSKVKSGVLVGCQDDGCTFIPGEGPPFKTEFEFAPSDLGSALFLVQVTGFSFNSGPYKLAVQCGTDLPPLTGPTDPEEQPGGDEKRAENDAIEAALDAKEGS